MKIGYVLMALVLLSTAAMADPSSERSFQLLKSFAGTWTGKMTTDSDEWKTDQTFTTIIRVVSQGSAVIHELVEAKAEISMFTVEPDGLTLVHYCSFPNRPRLVAKPAGDSRSVAFDIVSFTGPDVPGHITHVVFTAVDADHRTETWTFEPVGQKPVHAVLNLARVH